jgi:hypothetical protein
MLASSLHPKHLGPQPILLERLYAPVWKWFSKVIYNSLNSFET